MSQVKSTRNADGKEFNSTMYYTDQDQPRPKYLKLVCVACGDIVIGDPGEQTIAEHQKAWPKHIKFKEMEV